MGTNLNGPRPQHEGPPVRDLRALRLIVPDARSTAIRPRVAREVAVLNRAREVNALKWIEAVAEFDASPDRKRGGI